MDRRHPYMCAEDIKTTPESTKVTNVLQCDYYFQWFNSTAAAMTSILVYVPRRDELPLVSAVRL